MHGSEKHTQPLIEAFAIAFSDISQKRPHPAPFLSDGRVHVQADHKNYEEDSLEANADSPNRCDLKVTI